MGDQGRTAAVDTEGGVCAPSLQAEAAVTGLGKLPQELRLRSGLPSQAAGVDVYLQGWRSCDTHAEEA